MNFLNKLYRLPLYDRGQGGDWTLSWFENWLWFPSVCAQSTEIWEQPDVTVVRDLKSPLTLLPSHLWSIGGGAALTKTFDNRHFFLILGIQSLSWIWPFYTLPDLSWAQGGHYRPHHVAICSPLGDHHRPQSSCLLKAWNAVKCSALPDLPESL